MKTKSIVLTLLLVMLVGVGFATAQVVTEEPAVGGDRILDREDRGAVRAEVREAVREALRDAAIEEREPIREDAASARHVGTTDERRSATAVGIQTTARPYGLRFVRRFVRRCSLRRLKSGSR